MTRDIKTIPAEFVQGIAPCEEIAKKILARAREYKKGKREEGYSDNKAIPMYREGYKKYSFTRGLVTLINAGARIDILNEPEGERYHHEVLYEGHRFVDVSEYPIVPVISPRNR